MEHATMTNFAESAGIKDFLKGFIKISDLRNRTSAISGMPGVYMVLRRSPEHPTFLKAGSGGFFKGKNPNVPISELEANWVESEAVVYIGMTTQPLRKRISTYLRFGDGEDVGHYGGRYIWQLADHEDLEFCWLPMPTGDPRARESELIEAFKLCHNGQRPFANLKD